MKKPLLCCIGLFLMTAPAAAYQNAWREDRLLTVDLRANGTKVERDAVAVYFDPGQLTTEQMEEFATLAERGVRDIAKLAGSPPPESKISYFVSERVEISHSRTRTVFLPLERVRRRTAPYLHESTHVLVACRGCSTWLSEGYASYLQSSISEHVGGYDGQIFTRHGNPGVDRDAVRWLNNPRGKAMLPYVGTDEDPPDLSDRNGVAAPFYVLSQSLVKFLVESAGLHTPAEITDAKDLPRWRRAWLKILQE